MYARLQTPQYAKFIELSNYGLDLLAVIRYNERVSL